MTANAITVVETDDDSLPFFGTMKPVPGSVGISYILHTAAGLRERAPEIAVTDWLMKLKGKRRRNGFPRSEADKE
jgi:hypothetical protein